MTEAKEATKGVLEYVFSDERLDIIDKRDTTTRHLLMKAEDWKHNRTQDELYLALGKALDKVLGNPVAGWAEPQRSSFDPAVWGTADGKIIKDEL